MTKSVPGLSWLRSPETWGALAGFALGAGDAWLLRALGVEWQAFGRDATALVAIWFGLTCGALGYLAARLFRLRRQSLRDADVIRAQADELRASRRAAIQNEKLAAIGRLAAGVAHEVRNPLGVIRSSASMLQEGFAADGDDFKACQFICDEIDRLDGLISSLLRFARPVDLEARPVEVGGVVERAMDLARRASAEKPLACEVEDRSSHTLLRGDPDLLAQVLFDLVTNAAEMQAGRVVVRAEGSIRGVRLEVADDGPGVPEELAERVFEPFFTTKATGTGLGLAMAARIVQAHGGEIQVVPGRGVGAEGAGACFRVDLPGELAVAA